MLGVRPNAAEATPGEAGAVASDALVVERLSHGYGGGEPSDLVLKDLSLKVPRGHFVSLLGRSGCGKTTLLRNISGLEIPLSGSIHWDGRRLEGPGPERAVVFQEHNLLPWKTVEANIAWGARLMGVPAGEVKSRARHLIRLIGLEGHERSLPRQLSGGMRQRVGIARALATDASLLLMDEPFGALDAYTREQMQVELLRLLEEERRTVVFVTHSIDEALLLSDEIVVFTQRPARVGKVLKVPFPRPRAKERELAHLRSSAEWLSLREELGALLAGSDG